MRRNTKIQIIFLKRSFVPDVLEEKANKVIPTKKQNGFEKRG
jgi:hypothetical protein